MLENDAPIVNKFAHRFVSFQNRLILVFAAISFTACAAARPRRSFRGSRLIDILFSSAVVILLLVMDPVVIDVRTGEYLGSRLGGRQSVGMAASFARI